MQSRRNNYEQGQPQGMQKKTYSPAVSWKADHVILGNQKTDDPKFSKMLLDNSKKENFC